MDVLMPQLGETVAEGKITKWFKSAGDAVKPGDNLFEIETDKVSMEVPSTTAGTLAEIRVGVGAVAPVGAVVAVIAGEGAAATSTPTSPLPLPSGERVGVRGSSSPDSARTPSPQPSPPEGRSRPSSTGYGGEGVRAVSAATPRAPSGPLDPFFEVRTPERNFGPARVGGNFVTPLARRLASEAGIDLSRITPSGAHGRIVARDIETAAASQPRGGATALARGPSAAEVIALYRHVPFEEVPLDGMRKTIATRLVQAKQTIPHFYLTADIDIGRLLAMREDANAAAPKGADKTPAYKLSVNDLVIKMWAAALQRIPAANAVWAEDRILRFKHSDIGIAVAVEGGLITPVIRQAEQKTLTAISAEMRELAERGRARKLKPSEYQGGSSAISNLGMYGVREFSAIINPPHATILAVGASRRQAVEKADGSVGFASMMTVTLSCDHRVVDGALGAELLAAFRGFVEQPVTALV
jgi:pyruvate dehydrogenase E2 component (dihydrolipoamide acetyltransferase)